MLTLKLIILILYIIVRTILDCSIITLAVLGFETLITGKNYKELFKKNGKWYFICSALVYVVMIIINIIKLL